MRALLHDITFQVKFGHIFRPQFQRDLFLDNIIAVFERPVDNGIGGLVYAPHAYSLSGITALRFEHQVVPVCPRPLHQVRDIFSARALSLPMVKLAGPGGPPYRFPVETLPVLGVGDNLKHAFGINRLRASGVDYPAFPHRLEQRFQVMPAVQS